MRTLAALTVLILVSCSGPPTPEEVAGIYDVYSEVDELAEGDENSYELREDGTIVSTLILQELGLSGPGGGRFSVSEGEGGCIDILAWEVGHQEDNVSGTACGDMWTMRGREGGREVVYKKRHKPNMTT